MLGPNGVITVSGDPKNAQEAEVVNLEVAISELTDALNQADTSTTAPLKKARPTPEEQGGNAAPQDPTSSSSTTPAG